MNWKVYLRTLSEEFEFHDAAAHYQLVDAELKLNLMLPDQLHALLIDTNGVEGAYGLGLSWPIERIVEDNLRFRQFEDFRAIYMPYDNLLFFGDAGNGDQFAFPIDADSEIHRPDIFAWNHENDSRSWIASSLMTYFDWWNSGKIKL